MSQLQRENQRRVAEQIGLLVLSNVELSVEIDRLRTMLPKPAPEPEASPAEGQPPESLPTMGRPE